MIDHKRKYKKDLKNPLHRDWQKAWEGSYKRGIERIFCSECGWVGCWTRLTEDEFSGMKICIRCYSREFCALKNHKNHKVGEYTRKWKDGFNIQRKIVRVD